MRHRAAMLMAALAASPAVGQQAQVDLDAIASCAEAAASPALAAACIEPALAPCDAVEYETPAVAMLCYETARQSFDVGITAERQRLSELNMPVDTGYFTINAKYDMLTALLDCERAKELAMLSDHQLNDIERGKARCTTAVSAVTWLKLRLALRE